jgi:hypothetical protein
MNPNFNLGEDNGQLNGYFAIEDGPCPDEYLLPTENVDELTTDVVGYLSGLVEKVMWKKIGCKICLAAIRTESTITNDLITMKDRLRPFTPQKSTFNLCRTAEIFLRVHTVDLKMGKMSIHYAETTVIRHCLTQFPSIFNEMPYHDDGPLNNHRILLIKQIIGYYLHIRMRHICKTWLEDIKPRDDRNFCKKMLQFSGI